MSKQAHLAHCSFGQLDPSIATYNITLTHNLAHCSSAIRCTVHGAPVEIQVHREKHKQELCVSNVTLFGNLLG